MGVYVRLLLVACEQGERSAVRAQALRLLRDMPPDFSAARTLLRDCGTSAREARANVAFETGELPDVGESTALISVAD